MKEGGNEKVSFGSESDKSIKHYEKQVSKLDNYFDPNTPFENIFAKIKDKNYEGPVTKEEIIRIDADIENELRKKVSRLKEVIASFEQPENIHRGGGEEFEKDLEKTEKQLEILTKSDLNLYEEDDDEVESVYARKRTMEGEINGQKVKLIEHYQADPITPEDKEYDNYFGWEGTINGKEIPEEEIRELFKSQESILTDRNSKIDKLIESKKRKKEKDEDQTKIDRTKDDLKKMYDKS